jgi:hypothetical protein
MNLSVKLMVQFFFVNDVNVMLDDLNARCAPYR